jgi:hypothetical protein
MKASKLHFALLLVLTALIALMIGRLAVAAEWAPAGITQLEGVQAITAAPGKARTLYAGVEEHEPIRHSVYQSPDSGRHWQLLSDNLPSKITALAVPADDGQTLYAGTESLGVLKSADGGTSWTPVNQGLGPMPNATVTSLTIDSQNPNLLRATIGYYLGTSQAHFAPMGTWVSTDGGASWSQVSDRQQ